MLLPRIAAAVKIKTVQLPVENPVLAISKTDTIIKIAIFKIIKTRVETKAARIIKTRDKVITDKGIIKATKTREIQIIRARTGRIKAVRITKIKIRAEGIMQIVIFVTGIEETMISGFDRDRRDRDRRDRDFRDRDDRNRYYRNW